MVRSLDSALRRSGSSELGGTAVAHGRQSTHSGCHQFKTHCLGSCRGRHRLSSVQDTGSCVTGCHQV
jgi:hypothetical protein